jgi:hypothetical protein
MTMTMTMTMTMSSCPYAQVTLLMKDVKAISKELHEQVRYATQSHCRTFTEANKLGGGEAWLPRQALGSGCCSESSDKPGVATAWDFSDRLCEEER